MDCRPAMDFESFGDMSKEQINQAALAYLTRLERLCGGSLLQQLDRRPCFRSKAGRLSALDRRIWPGPAPGGGALEGLGWVSVYQSRSGAGNSRKCGFGSVHAGYGLGKRRDDASAGRADCFGSVWGHIVGHFTEIWRLCGADRPAKRHSQPQFDLPRSAAANTELICRIVDERHNRYRPSPWGACLFSNRRNTDKGKIGFIV